MKRAPGGFPIWTFVGDDEGSGDLLEKLLGRFSRPSSSPSPPALSHSVGGGEGGRGREAEQNSRRNITRHDTQQTRSDTQPTRRVDPMVVVLILIMMNELMYK